MFLLLRLILLLMFTICHRTSSTGVLPLGSDFPVEGINPLLGFYAAVSRLSPSGDSPHGSQGWCDPSRVLVATGSSIRDSFQVPVGTSNTDTSAERSDPGCCLRGICGGQSRFALDRQKGRLCGSGSGYHDRPSIRNPGDKSEGDSHRRRGGLWQPMKSTHAGTTLAYQVIPHVYSPNCHIPSACRV